MFRADSTSFLAALLTGCARSTALGQTSLRYLDPDPRRQQVFEAVLAEIQLNAIPIAKRRCVACLVVNADHRLEHHVALLERKVTAIAFDVCDHANRGVGQVLH